MDKSILDGAMIKLPHEQPTHAWEPITIRTLHVPFKPIHMSPRSAEVTFLIF